MPTLNPDFRGADEVFVPANLKDMCGWTDGTISESEAVLKERFGQDDLMKSLPMQTTIREEPKPLPAIVDAWNSFQASKGRGPGSCDWSLLDEFIYGKPLLWLPQIIGSCVISNSFRGFVIRQNYQIAILGEPQEYFGKNEFGQNNLAFYGPWLYGAARKRANMRGGDGLYCEALQKSFLLDGVVTCSTPKLVELLTKLGAAKEKDFPEPQNERLYRQFGDWNYIEELRPYADFKLADCPTVTSQADLKACLEVGKPVFHCSMVAIHKVGTHKDGFAIHKRNPRDQWAHNMCYHGFFYASDGELFYRMSNESWPDGPIYNLPASEVDDFYARRNVTSAAIGRIQGPMSAPVSIA